MGFTDSVLQQLSQPLDADRVKTRVGGGNTRLSYLEGYDIIDRLNAIFGHDGWHGVATLPVLVAPGVYQAGYTLTVGDVTRSDVGHGLVNGDRAEAHEMAGKGAVTDAMKRAARTLGDQFGNSLYDKDSPLHSGGNATVRPAIPGNAPVFRTQGSAAAPRPANSGGTISAAQVAFIGRLGGTDADAMARFGVATLADIPKGSAASAWIDELKAGGSPAPARSAPARQPNPLDDVPF